MPTAIAALEAGAEAAELKPGEAMFRRFDGLRGVITSERLAPDAVARIVRERVRARALACGSSAEEADELALATSGHSLRAGFITSAARAGVPEWKIRARSRHKSAEQVASYIRAAEEWTDSGLKGLGF